MSARARRGQPDDHSVRPTRIAFEKRGLGYAARFPEAGAEMMIDHLVQYRGEVRGELVVERLDPDVYDGALMQASFNVSSFGDRERAAHYLGERSNGFDWTAALEIFCTKVLRAERAGQPFVEIGQAPPAEAVKFLLHPLLPEGRPTIIYGEGGVGKSTLARAIVVSVSTGIPALEGWHVDAARPVLVLDWEADEGEWNDGVAAVARGLGIDPPLFHYRACAGNLPDQLHDVATHVSQVGAGLVIVDSVGMAMPSRGDGADANEGALKLFGALRVLGASTLLVDHVTGADMGVERAVSKPYGSVYKWNLARQVFELRSTGTQSDGALHLALHHRKANATAKLGARGIAIHHGPAEVLLVAEDLDAIEANAPRPLHGRIYTLLLTGGRDSRKISVDLNVSENSVRSTLNRMRDDGMVTKVAGRGGIWAAVYKADMTHVSQGVMQLGSDDPVAGTQGAGGNTAQAEGGARHQGSADGEDEGPRAQRDEPTPSDGGYSW